MASRRVIREKIITLPKLAEKFRKARQAGLKTVFTNGCFDILHAGHILFLEEARSLGDLLAVGLNTDRSVRQIKGPSRPITPEGERALVVSALEPVDFVCLFDEPIPLKLIKALKPHFLVKGQDWREKGVVGREEVEGWGGEVVLLPLEEGMSSTGIIQRIREI